MSPVLGKTGLIGIHSIHQFATPDLEAIVHQLKIPEISDFQMRNNGILIKGNYGETPGYVGLIMSGEVILENAEKLFLAIYHHKQTNAHPTPNLFAIFKDFLQEKEIYMRDGGNS